MVSNSDCRFLDVVEVVVLPVGKVEVARLLEGRDKSIVLASESAACFLLLYPELLFDCLFGEVCADRYKLLVERRGRMEGSDRLAMDLAVRSLANAAKVNKPALLGRENAADSADW